jgi:hypothetical protein
MKDCDYRLLAIELVRQIQHLLVHPGSKAALVMAEAWAKGESLKDSALEHARAQALENCVQCAGEVRDGRDHAAEAAWQLLAPQVEEWIGPIIENIAKAKALHTVFKKHGGLTPTSQDEFDYIRAVEQELLEDRVAKRKSKG